MRDWNERYRTGAADSAASPLLIRAVSGEKPGHALDLACGGGRNAVYLASQGWMVTAVDSSEVAIEQLEARIGRDHPSVKAVLANLEEGEFELPGQSYDLICDIFYLQRSLFPAMRNALRQGGLFVGSIHMLDSDPSVKAMNRSFLLQPGELRREFDGWEVIHGQERRPAPGKRLVAELIARKPGAKQ